MDTGEIHSKLKKAIPGSVLEKSRFGRSAQLSLWVESRSLPDIAAFLVADADIALDWLENLSAIQMDDAVVLTYFLRRSSGAEGPAGTSTLILRASIELKGAAKEVTFQSVAKTWAMAAPFEAEIQEMFGVRFLDPRGEPAYQGPGKLPAGWTGFPLRKSYVFPSEFLGIQHARVPMAPEGEA